MVGALDKVWPWKETLTWRTNSSGEQVPLNEASISPFSFAEIMGQDSQLLLAFLFALAGLATVLAVEWAGKRT
jgi:putative membrane protein